MILYATVVLMVVIFMELALQTVVVKFSISWWIFYVVNYILFTFFIIEICLKFFCYGFEFFSDLINTIDCAIVITSFVFHVLMVETKILGLLRVLRLVKVIGGMKKAVDEKRANQKLIKEQKKQSKTIPSYVERIIDFLEKQEQDEDIPTPLREDI
jgi:hypothetical protein